MTRDYSNKQKYSAKQRKPVMHGSARRKSPLSSGIKWLIAGLTVGVLLTVVMYFTNQHQEKLAQQTVKQNAKQSPSIITKPRFDFFTILPNSKVSDNSAERERLTSDKKVAKQTPKQRYLLQLASMTHFKDADRLKAQLTLLGFDVTVNKAIFSNMTVYRVQMGPYADRNSAAAAQRKLHNSRIDSIIKKAP